MDSFLIVILLLIVGFLLLCWAIVLGSYFIRGVLNIFEFASEQGFIGMAAFFCMLGIFIASNDYCFWNKRVYGMPFKPVD